MIFSPKTRKIAQRNVCYIFYNAISNVDLAVSKVTANQYLERKRLLTKLYIDTSMKVSIDIEISDDVRISDIERKVIYANKRVCNILLDSVNKYIED